MVPGFTIEIPIGAQVQLHLLVAVSAGKLLIIVFAAPGVHGVVIGMHGAVAPTALAATAAGFIGELQIPNGMMFVIGSTDEEAYRKWAELEEYRSPEAQTAYFSSLSGMDLGQFDPATPLRDILEEIPGIRGAFLSMINAWPADSTPTVKDFLSSMALPQMVVGSPETIAARLLEYQGAGVDGVQVMNALLPQSYEEFFDHLVPVLQDKGLMQKQYRPGTLRQKLFDAATPDISERHPAHGYRGMFCDQRG